MRTPHRFIALLAATLVSLGIITTTSGSPASAWWSSTSVIQAPNGGKAFGRGSSQSVVVLSNGNYVITDFFYSDGTASNLGAVYLVNGSTHAVISTLTGSSASDQVGSRRILELTGTDTFVVISPLWGGDKGPVSLCSAVIGCSGTVSAANSLLGSAAGMNVGERGVIALSNGNYVVSTPGWDDGATLNVGAVTWCNGTTGCTGPVTTSNSLHGTTASDYIGWSGSVALSNGNYVVPAPNWDNGATINAGAVAWCNGMTGCTGPVTTSNSLHGTQANDEVGGISTANTLFVTALTGNGKYVVASPRWDNSTTVNTGAVTLCDGATGCNGPVTTSNSLHGTVTGGSATTSPTGDEVGSSGIVALSDGDYVVRSANWDNGVSPSHNVGAVTWCSGATGCTGPVTTSNSLYGTTAQDTVGTWQCLP